MIPVLTRARKQLAGVHDAILGNTANLSGVVSPDLRGDVSRISGAITPDLVGDVTGITGDITGLRGDATGLTGDLTAAGITPADRAAGIHLSMLTLK